MNYLIKKWITSLCVILIEFHIMRKIVIGILFNIGTNTPFTFVHDKPFRSGMISLIYMLRHKESGEQYILKMKRKLIKEKLDKSIYRMSLFFQIIINHCILVVKNESFRDNSKAFRYGF